MGLYGKYTNTVHVLATTQMVVGVLMLLLGIALRIFVCSWVTNAAFGFWVGLWVRYYAFLFSLESQHIRIYGNVVFFRFLLEGLLERKVRGGMFMAW